MTPNIYIIDVGGHFNNVFEGLFVSYRPYYVGRISLVFCFYKNEPPVSMKIPPIYSSFNKTKITPKIILVGTKSIFETHFVRDFLKQNQFRGLKKH